ncbi:MAG: sulfite exporter TauE/SafE family protein [Fimbriimonadaceae bacterium]
MEAFGFVSLAVAGVLLGITGGGGGILVTPILVGLFGIAATRATGVSLALVGLAAAIGAVGYGRSGQVDLRSALALALSSGVGALVARAVLLPMVPHMLGPVMSRDRALTMVFGLAMLATAVAMLRPRRVIDAPSQGWPLWTTLLAGLGIGLFSGVVGAGGGFLIVPALILGAKMDAKRAVGTSLAVIAVTAGFGVSGELMAGAPMDPAFMASAGAAMLGGMAVGMLASKRIAASVLRPVFGTFVLVVGLAVLGASLIA